MGLGKRLDLHRSSFDSLVTGSVGWQPPELILINDDDDVHDDDDINHHQNKSSDRQRLTKSVDIFSLGCIIYYIITNGKHPYGDNIEREKNITLNQINLNYLTDDKLSDVLAKDLISSMIQYKASLRCTADEVKHHLYFWNDDVRLQFILDVSDTLEDCKKYSIYKLLIEQDTTSVIGDNWKVKLSPLLLDNLKRYRRYNQHYISDFLRVIRNKKHHYHELPTSLKSDMGTMPSGFINYFLHRFPKLLLYIYIITAKICYDTSIDLFHKPNQLYIYQNIFKKYYTNISPKRIKHMCQHIQLNTRSWYQHDEFLQY